MEGYTVIAGELAAQLRAGAAWPDVVYLQAGVGGMAAAVTERIRADWDVQPEIVVVEPDAAPCLRDSAAAGKIRAVQGPVSSMGRLDCKVASLLALEILSKQADRFVTVSDAAADDAAEMLGDAGHPTTPSGAAGLAACLAENADRPLIVVTEGPEPGSDA